MQLCNAKVNRSPWKAKRKKNEKLNLRRGTRKEVEEGTEKKRLKEAFEGGKERSRSCTEAV